MISYRFINTGSKSLRLNTFRSFNEEYVGDVDKLLYYKFIETYKSLQKSSLSDLSDYSVLANNIFQQEIHQNIDILNFTNQMTFQKAYRVTGVLG